MNIELLQKFCSKDNLKPSLQNPFSQNGYTYATNSYIIVRVDKIDGFGVVEDASDITKVNEWLDEKHVDWIDFPVFNLEEVECPKCKGCGYLYECPECNGDGVVTASTEYNFYHDLDCKTCGGIGVLLEDEWNEKCFTFEPSKCQKCDGTGKAYKEENLYVLDKLFNTNYLKIIKELKNVKFCISNDEQGMIFKFDGGVGFLMKVYDGK